MKRSAHGVPFLSCRICPSTNPAAPACPWAGAKSASPRQARPDYRRWAWVTPLACGLKPSGNRTVKTLHRSVFSQSSGRAISSLAARFPERSSPIVFGLHPITPTPARHKNAMRCFHQSSSCAKPAGVLRQPTSPDAPPSGHGRRRPPPADRGTNRNRSRQSLTSARSGRPAAPSAPREPAR